MILNILSILSFLKILPKIRKDDKIVILDVKTWLIMEVANEQTVFPNNSVWSV